MYFGYKTIYIIYFASLITDKFAGVLSTNYDFTNTKLELIIAVFRHGQRTPASTYPTDPHKKNEFFPTGWGGLTNEGKQQQYLLGEFLRKRYNNFLNETYSNNFVHAQSTDVDRTKMGLQLVLAGLYPPKGNQVWSNKLNWQPIPTHYEPQNEDKLLLVTIPCFRYYEALEEVMQLDEIKSQIAENDEIYHYLTSNSGMNVNSFNDILSIQGTLRAESDMNLTLPEWTNKVYPEPLNTLAAKSFILNSYTKELQKLKGGQLLKQILNIFSNKVINTLKPEQRQIYLYAGHDSTIAYLLRALNLWKVQIPEYNSLILLELHYLDKNQHGLKILFRNTTEQEPQVLILPGCEEICPLEQVIFLTKDVIPGDLITECRPKNSDYRPQKMPEI